MFRSLLSFRDKGFVLFKYNTTVLVLNYCRFFLVTVGIYYICVNICFQCKLFVSFVLFKVDKTTK